MRNKPINMKYTDLCKYIDEHLYYRDENNKPIGLKPLSNQEIDNIYTYLYHIIIALSVKKRLMSNKNDYSDFALEATGKIFERITKKDQDFTFESRNNKPVVSILNYIKGCLGFLAITYRQESYREIIKPERDPEAAYGARVYCENLASEQFSNQLKYDLETLMDNLDITINEVLNKSMYKNNESKLSNLKISIYLSLLNSLTLENKHRLNKDKKKEKILLKQLKHKDDYICLWREDGIITKSLVQFYLKKVLLAVYEDFKYIKSTSVPSEDIIEAIISSASPTYGLNQVDKE